MVARDKQVLDKILIFDTRTFYTTSTSSLGTIMGQWIFFDISFVRNRDDHLFICHQVFFRKLFGFLFNTSATLITKFFLNLLQLTLDLFKNQFFAGKQLLELSRMLFTLIPFLF